jgi:hypothetical protein
MLLRSICSRLIFALMFIPPTSQATSPCGVEGGCIDEASATFLGIQEVYDRKCAAADPTNAGRYHEELRTTLAGEDATFLVKLRNSAIYEAVKKPIELEANGMERQTLLKNCESFLPRR